jgi:acyl-CoA synthetase (AMP-forming)/AMP-acid ligase II
MRRHTFKAAADDDSLPVIIPRNDKAGEPEGVMHSDNTLLATARMMARDWRLERAILYTLSPLSHNLGLGALITALAGGGELVVHDLTRGESLLDRLQDTGAEFLFGVPSPCDRPAHRDPSPRRAACRRRARLPDLGHRRAGRRTIPNPAASFGPMAGYLLPRETHQEADDFPNRPRHPERLLPNAGNVDLRLSGVQLL